MTAIDLTYGDLKLKLLGAVDDDGVDDLVGDWINMVYLDLYTRRPWRFRNTSTTFTVAGGIAPYVLPADCGEITAIVDSTNNRRLKQTTRQEVLRLDPSLAVTGTPSQYFMDVDGYITFYPSSDASLTAYYIQKPIVMVNDVDTPDIPNEFRHLLILGGKASYYEFTGDTDLQSAATMTYEKALILMARYYDTQPDRSCQWKLYDENYGD